MDLANMSMPGFAGQISGLPFITTTALQVVAFISAVAGLKLIG
jgi:hypothetical protein